MCFRLWSFITCCPLHVPKTAGGLRAQSSPTLSLGNCPPSGRHSDWARSKNDQLTHTAGTNASGRFFVVSIFASNARAIAGSRAFIRSPERTKSSADCATALVLQSRPHPNRAPALYKCEEYCWGVLADANCADTFGATPSEGRKPKHLGPAATNSRLRSQLRKTFAPPTRAPKRRICSTISALPSALASLLGGPPVVSSSGSKPICLDASREALPILMESSEFRVTISASREALCASTWATASPLLRMSDA